MRFLSRLFKLITNKPAGKSRDDRPVAEFHDEKPRQPPNPNRNRQQAHRGVIHLGDNPLDPHGNGTIRRGDPIYDLMMGGGRAMIANSREDGNWEVEIIPDDDEKS